jgi:hypothetical protein
MTVPDAAVQAPLDDDLLTLDVADTLRRGGVMPQTETGDGDVVARLQALYAQQGLRLDARLAVAGAAAAADGRFVHRPARGPLAGLARLYVGRGRWGPPLAAVALVLVVGIAAYYLGYRPYRASQRQQARLELTQNLPAEMDALYQTIFNETKVTAAATQAADIRDKGKAAAEKGDRAGADRAVADLTALRDRLEENFTLRIADRDGIKPGFWTFPRSNTEATNYYIVVEAVDAQGNVLSLPITSEDTGKTQVVDHWGLRVPQSVYDAVIADKDNNGVISHGLVGFKQDGFLDIDYAIPNLGGTLTEW